MSTRYFDIDEKTIKWKFISHPHTAAAIYFDIFLGLNIPMIKKMFALFVCLLKPFSLYSIGRRKHFRLNFARWKRKTNNKNYVFQTAFKKKWKIRSIFKFSQRNRSEQKELTEKHSFQWKCGLKVDKCQARFDKKKKKNKSTGLKRTRFNRKKIYKYICQLKWNRNRKTCERTTWNAIKLEKPQKKNNKNNGTHSNSRVEKCARESHTTLKIFYPRSMSK